MDLSKSEPRGQKAAGSGCALLVLGLESMTFRGLCHSLLTVRHLCQRRRLERVNDAKIRDRD